MLMIRNIYLRIAIYDPARDGTRGSRRWGHAAVSFWMNAGRGLSEWSSCVYDRKYRLIDSVQHLGRRFTSCEPPNVDLTILISDAVVRGSGQMIWHFSGAINANGMWNSICLKVFSTLFFLQTWNFTSKSSTALRSRDNSAFKRSQSRIDPSRVPADYHEEKGSN